MFGCTPWVYWLANWQGDHTVYYITIYLLEWSSNLENHKNISVWYDSNTTYLIVPGHDESKFLHWRCPYFHSDDALKGDGCSARGAYSIIYGEIKCIIQPDVVQFYVHLNEAALHFRVCHEKMWCQWPIPCSPDVALGELCNPVANGEEKTNKNKVIQQVKQFKREREGEMALA